MTPLERAARALARRSCPPGGEAQFPYVSADEWEKKNWRDHAPAARAVLEAIREPFQAFDDPVAIAGGEVLGAGKDRPLHWTNYHEAKKVWQAMIDAALAESEQ